MSRKRTEIAQKRLQYIRVQFERFLWKYYKLKDMNIKFYLKKKLQKQYLYSRAIFPEEHNLEELIEIEYDFDLVSKKGNKSLLPFAFREAVRVGMWANKRPFVNGVPEFEAELRKYGLPAFGSVAETGMELNTYGCQKCKRIYILKENKLPKSKDPSQQADVKTGCCGEVFEYFGKKFYKNEDLQKIHKIKSIKDD